MKAHTETHISPYPTDALYELIVDIERYPEFLPWCLEANIHERHESHLVADLVISFKAFRETFTSKVLLTPPTGENTPCAIKVELIDGPFHHLNNHWSLAPTKEGGTEITFTIDFRFRSALLDKMIGFMFEAALKKMIHAFEKRADVTLGNS